MDDAFEGFKTSGGEVTTKVTTKVVETVGDLESEVEPEDRTQLLQSQDKT